MSSKKFKESIRFLTLLFLAFLVAGAAVEIMKLVK
jgi:hypothetical protein